MIESDRIDQFLQEHRRKAQFNVAPRYTSGSPALVDRNQAVQVAREEEGGYQHAAIGRYGPKLEERARTQGLLGIAEVRVETRKGWDVLDLITGERYIRPFKTGT
jgi:peptidoglycan/xylan/chitin deacetylase (PgdA/CDA1 family)